jgi:circadian clock protein KaiC
METLTKAPTGVFGLDEVLFGGLPAGRPTLVYGGPGCGKTILGMEFLCRGAQLLGEPGVFLSFDEARKDIIENFAISGFGLSQALADQTVRIESIPILDSQLTQAGEFTLDGLLLKLENLIDSIGAKRLVLDSIEALLSQFGVSANLRYELTRIFKWTKDKGLTTIVTNEMNSAENAHFGIDKYVADCVIFLDHRIVNQISKRRLRVVKCRGTLHGVDEYPYVINTGGFSVLPITSIGLGSIASDECITTGLDGLDVMLDGKGYFLGSSIMVSGSAGTGKTTFGACLAKGTCLRGGRSLYLSFEESASQLARNWRSVGIESDENTKKGLLRIEPMRPNAFGLEEHLGRVHRLVDEFRPDTVIMDPISCFLPLGGRLEVRAMLTRLMDYFKNKNITTLMTSLTPGGGMDEQTETEVSSIVDTWVVIRYRRVEGKRFREVYIHKARGIAHSQELGGLILSNSGPVVTPLVDYRTIQGINFDKQENH